MTAGGLMVTSQVTYIWQIFLSHSLVTGCGLCLLTQGTVYDLARSFNKSASLYIGVMYAGSSIGFIINPLVFSQVRLLYGWRGTILIASAVSMNMLPLVLLLFHQNASKVSNLDQNATMTEDHSGYNEHAGNADTCETGHDNTVLTHKQRDDQSEVHTDEENGVVEVVHHSDCIEYADNAGVCDMDKQDKIGMEHQQNNEKPDRMSKLDELSEFSSDKECRAVVRSTDNNMEEHQEETKQQAPSVLMLFKIPSLVIIAIVYFFGRFAYIGFFVHFTASLILRGFSEQDAALVFTAYGLGGLFGKSCCALPGQMGIMSNYNFYMLSMFIIGICFVIFSSLMNLVSLLFCGFVVGFFLGVFVGLFPAITQSCVSEDWFNFAYGYIGIPTGVSSALGGYIMGAVYDATGVYNTSFYIAGVCFFFNGFLMFASKCIPKCQNKISMAHNL
ncbi:monocarboxylate transporter 5-like [Anneissia japonica]|uniref:monocarboxylate transporter 5-like n=1 Tax=Anneissia japonica TaxID=1529436 RepID=UPI00142579F8|nr:monocarboxylate transporter 5-like [Anneissia japonica]